jgi:hypothetical protein
MSEPNFGPTLHFSGYESQLFYSEIPAINSADFKNECQLPELLALLQRKNLATFGAT